MNASSAAIDAAAGMLEASIGLRLEGSSRARLGRCIRDASRERRQTPEDYVDSVARDASALQELCDRMTVQETGFLRHPEHFDVLARHLLPELEAPVDIWSAACSTGQEAYSLAMVLAETRIEGRVIASDISSHAIFRTRQARYTEREVGALSPWRRSMHMQWDGDAWAIRPELRGRVDLRVHNLLDPLPPEMASCQVVFLRNVLIYFTAEHATSLLDRLTDRLPVGTYVLLGGAESIWHISERLEPVRYANTFVYRVRAADRARSGCVALPATAGAPGRHGSKAPRPSSLPSTKRLTEDQAAVGSPPHIDGGEVSRAGQEADRAGDHAAAIAAYRKWTYLEPDNLLAHFHLGAAFTASGDHRAASRAFGAARTLVQRGDPGALFEALGGYTVEQFLHLLEAKERVSP